MVMKKRQQQLCQMLLFNALATGSFVSLTEILLIGLLNKCLQQPLWSDILAVKSLVYNVDEDQASLACLADTLHACRVL